MNSRLDTIQAAILLPKLAVLDEEITGRQHAAENYNKLFSNCKLKSEKTSIDFIQIPYIESYNTSSWAQYTIQVPNREILQAKLKEAGIATVVHYPIPLNKQPAVADLVVELPVGDMVAKNVLSLSMNPNLLQKTVEKILE